MKYFVADKFSLIHIEPFVIGALVTAIFVFAGVLSYFAEQFRLAAAATAINIVILFVLRFTLL